MYESRDANPYYQSADADFDAARAAWERQGEQTVRSAGTPTFACGDQVLRRSYRYTTVGTVVAVAGSRVRVHWPAIGNRTWLQPSALVAATPELLAERRRQVADARAARRLTCSHRWGARTDESLFCPDCRTVWEASMGERPHVRPYHMSMAEWERQDERAVTHRTDDALLAAREAYRYAREKADELYGYDGDDPLVRSYYARQHTAWLKNAASEIAYAHRLTLRQVTGGDGR